MNTLKSLVLVSILTLGAGVLSGCGGGHTTVQHSPSNKTLGQELQDLDAAHDKGIVTDREYEDSKKKLIKKYTN